MPIIIGTVILALSALGLLIVHGLKTDAPPDISLKGMHPEEGGFLSEVADTGGGSYELYAPEMLARAKTEDVVLFFRAPWCSTCSLLYRDIESKELPSGITILEVNFDTETELKRKYGVTLQHTLVQVEADGTLIKKWSGSPTLESVLEEIE